LKNYLVILKKYKINTKAPALDPDRLNQSPDAPAITITLTPVAIVNSLAIATITVIH